MGLALVRRSEDELKTKRTIPSLSIHARAGHAHDLAPLYEFSALIRDEYARWSKSIQAAGIKAE